MVTFKEPQVQHSNKPSSQDLSKKKNEKAHLPNSTGVVKTVHTKENAPVYKDTDHQY